MLLNLININGNNEQIYCGQGKISKRVINNKNGAVKFMVQTKGYVRGHCKKMKKPEPSCTFDYTYTHFSACPFHYVK